MARRRRRRRACTGPAARWTSGRTAVLEAYPGQLVLVGASMGGYCALAAVRRAPERIAGLVLVGSRPDADSPERRAKRAETIALARERGAEGIWRSMREPLFSPDADPAMVAHARELALERTEEELVAAIEAIRDRPDSTAAYRGLGDRALTIVGDRDPYVAGRGGARLGPRTRSSWRAAATCRASSGRPSSVASSRRRSRGGREQGGGRAPARRGRLRRPRRAHAAPSTPARRWRRATRGRGAFRARVTSTCRSC